MTQKKRITVVVPCFNESDVIPLLYERLRRLEVEADYQVDIVLVDDGSTDDSWSQISSICRTHSNWKGVRLSRNFGHQRALWTGLQHAKGEAVFVIDADLQDPPELLGQFLEKWSEGFQVVYGVRTKRKESLWKRASYQAYYRILASISDVAIPVDSGDFCLMDRQVVEAILASNETTPFIRGLRAWVGFRQTPLEYERAARAAGKEKYGLRMLVDLALNGLFGFSRKPLRLILWLGLVMIGAGLVGTAACAISGLLGSSISGTEMLLAVAVSLLFGVSGVVLSALGIVGEYVGRVFEASSARPVTFVAETSEFDPPDETIKPQSLEIGFFNKRAA